MAINFVGIGADIIGATVVGGPTIIFDGSITGTCELTIAVPSQTATGAGIINAAAAHTVALSSAAGEGDVDVVSGSDTATLTVSQTATGTVLIVSAAAQSIAVPAQTATAEAASYFSSNLTIAVPTQSAVGDVDVSGLSSLGVGSYQFRPPTIGAFAIGAESSRIDDTLINFLSFVTQSTTGEVVVVGAASGTVSLTSEAAVTVWAQAASTSTIAVPSQTATYTCFWPAASSQSIAVPSQAFAATVDVAGTAANSGQAYVPAPAVIGAYAIGDEAAGDRARASGGLEASNVATGAVTVVGAAAHSIPSPTNTVLGGPVITAEAAWSIDIPSQSAVGQVFHNIQAAQTIAVPSQTFSVTVEVTGQSDTTVTMTEQASVFVFSLAEAHSVINLSDARARAMHHKPTARYRARRYGGSSYPAPTESGYLDWLSQWAS